MKQRAANVLQRDIFARFSLESIRYAPKKYLCKNPTNRQAPKLYKQAK